VHVFPNVSNRLAYHFQFFTPRGLAGFLRTHGQGFDIAHLHACRNLPVAISAAALRRLQVPYVMSPNGTAPAIERRILAKRVFDWAERRRTLRGASRVVAVTEAEETQLRALGVEDRRIAVVPNPIDEAEFASPPDGSDFRRRLALGDAPVVLFLGKLTPRKGVDVLLHAFDHLARPAARLVVAGNDMGSGRTIEALAARLELRDRIRRVDLLKRRERLDALAAADVVVYPSRDEVFGLVAVEALLCGTPVVVSDDSGCAEVVAQTGGGRTVPFGDAPRLALAIASVLDARDSWRSRAQAAAGIVLTRFGSAAVSERLERLYRDVVDHHRRAA
jgi:glycosyltransferase involved in cell wall biosynthesis